MLKTAVLPLSGELRTGRGAPCRGICPACGRPARVETLESWRPGRGWVRVQLLRCLGTEHHDRTKRCGRVTPMGEHALDMPEPTLNGRRAGGNHQAGDTPRPAPPAPKAEGSAAPVRAAADVTSPGTRLRKGRTRRLTREQVQDITRLYFDEGLKMRELVERTGLPQACMVPVIGLERKRRAREAGAEVDLLSLRHVSPEAGSDGRVLLRRHVLRESAAVEGTRPSLPLVLKVLQSQEVRAFLAFPEDVQAAIRKLLDLGTA